MYVENDGRDAAAACPDRAAAAAKAAGAMTTLIWLKLKSQRFLLPRLLVVLAFQLLLGQASSYVLADRQPPLSIAVQRQGDGRLSEELLNGLAAIPNLEIVHVSADLSREEVFRRERVQGLLIIPEQFDEQNDRPKSAAVQFYPAPGISNYDFATEQIANTIMQLRARGLLQEALEGISASAALAENIETTDLLSVVYEGPALQSSSLPTAPVFGVSALMLLLSFLHAALTAPTRESKLLLLRGRKAFLRQLAAALAVVWAVWLLVILSYFALLVLVLGAVIDPLVILSYIAIMIYSSMLAVLSAYIIGRHAAYWLFLPLFLLSMTIGGWLWAHLVVSPLLAPLVPVAAATASGSGLLLGAALLLAAALLALATLMLLIRLRWPAKSQ